MIKIPDKVVEATARGLARYNCDQWDSDPERFWPHFADQARAAIALIRAETLEEAAVVFDRYEDDPFTAAVVADHLRRMKEAPCSSS